MNPAVALYDRAAKTDTGRYRDDGPMIMLKKFHNLIKAKLYQEFASNATCLLDVGCGRGGDLYKYDHAGINSVCAIDISPASIVEAQSRYKQMRGANKVNVEFMHVQTFGTSDFKNPIGLCDAVSCMFALHYFFETETMLRQTIKNISANLRQGGVFFGCVPHGLSILSLLGDREQYRTSCIQLNRKFKNALCFGSAYDFAISDTVTQETSTEYLVFENVLTTIAKIYGLEPVLSLPEPLQALLSKTDKGVFKHFEPNYDARDQVETSRVFCAFVFVKSG